MTDHSVGESVQAEVEFKDLDGLLVNPTTVTLVVTDPNGATSSPGIANPSTGRFTAGITLTLAGVWAWRWTGVIGDLTAIVDETVTADVIGNYIDGDAILAIIPGISDEDAERLAEIVNLATEAHICEPIPVPTPPKVTYGLLLWASMLYGAPMGGESIMSSERIGDYSYTLTGGNTFDQALGGVPESVVPYLMPYLCEAWTTGEVFELDIWPRTDDKFTKEPWGYLSTLYGRLP